MDYPKKHINYFPWVAYAYNTSYNKRSKSMPFELVYSKQPLTIASYVPNALKYDIVGSKLFT